MDHYVINIDSIPMIIGPKKILADIGSTVKFFCQSELPVTWSFLGKKRVNNMEFNKYNDDNAYVLTIANVTRYNAGKYMCVYEKNDFVGVDIVKLKTRSRFLIKNYL